jgi:hypothetical protein
VVLPAAGILIILGLLLGWTDATRSRRERQGIRDALFPGDAAAPGVQSPRRRVAGTRRR